MIPNPDYKGPWSPKIIKNPAYQGPWEHPEVDNPEYAPNDKLYVHPNLKYVGFELWQVKSGTIFDNILVTDDVEKAKYDKAREEEAEIARKEREEFEAKSKLEEQE